MKKLLLIPLLFMSLISSPSFADFFGKGFHCGDSEQFKFIFTAEDENSKARLFWYEFGPEGLQPKQELKYKVTLDKISFEYGFVPTNINRRTLVWELEGVGRTYQCVVLTHEEITARLEKAQAKANAENKL